MYILGACSCTRPVKVDRWRVGYSTAGGWL